MAQSIEFVANATAHAASLTSTDYPQDNCAVPMHSNWHTGGGDHDSIRIPDCSDSTYFDAHHINIAADDGSWTVSVWNDDQSNHELHWSPNASYADGYSLGCEGENTVALLIEMANDLPVVYGDIRN